MGKLKVKLLTGRSGTDGSFVPGDKIDLPLKEALLLIEKEQAEPVTKKAYEAALEKQKKQDDDDAQREAELKAVLEKESLQLELSDLYRQVALKVAEIEGIVLNDEEITAFVDEKMQGEALSKKQNEGKGE